MLTANAHRNDLKHMFLKPKLKAHFVVLSTDFYARCKIYTLRNIQENYLEKFYYWMFSEERNRVVITFPKNPSYIIWYLGLKVQWKNPW